MIFEDKSLSLFKVALIEAEIPSNKGNIERTKQPLELVVGPLDFELTDKKLKRPELDYWKTPKKKS